MPVLLAIVAVAITFLGALTLALASAVVLAALAIDLMAVSLLAISFLAALALADCFCLPPETNQKDSRITKPNKPTWSWLSGATSSTSSFKPCHVRVDIKLPVTFQPQSPTPTHCAQRPWKHETTANHHRRPHVPRS